MHDPTTGLRGLPDATPHEAAVIPLLIAARREPELVPEARALAGRALQAWRTGYELRGALYVLRWDASARLAAIRARLLADLAELAPADAPPLEALRSLGDATPEGWTIALHAALRRARPPLPHAREPRRAAPPDFPAGSWDGAAEAIREDDEAVAATVDGLEAGGVGGTRLMLGYDRAKPQLALRFDAHGGHDTIWREVPRESWSAAAALVATLHAAPALGLPQAYARWVPRTLRAALADLLRGRCDGRDAVERVLAEWGRAEVAPAESRAWRWPGTFAPLLAAADRLAATHAGLPVAARPVPGAWLEQAGPDGSVAAAGRVLEQRSLRRPARRRGGGTGRHRGSATPIPLLVDGEERYVALGDLRLPQRPLLFP